VESEQANREVAKKRATKSGVYSLKDDNLIILPLDKLS
jgi:hypothetical protein